MQVKIQVQLLNQITSQRWLKTGEVYQLLCYPPQDIIVSSILPHKPQHGSWYFLQKDLKRGWKQDGHEYLPRSNGVGTREDVEKLKIKGKQQILCLYSYVTKSSLENQEKSIIMHRRIYKLIDEPNSNYFVHYLKSDNFSKKMPESQVTKLSDQAYNEENNSTNYNLREYPTNSQGYLQQNFTTPQQQFYNEQDDFQIENFLVDESQDIKKDIFQIEQYLGQINQDNYENFIKSDQKNNNDIVLIQSSTEQIEDTFKEKIIQLEKRIQSLEFERYSNTTNQTSSSEKEDYIIKITEYSPEWDYIEGGSKIIICYKPLTQLNNIEVNFGEKVSIAQCVQPGVLKCFVPQHDEGCVKLTFLIQGKRVDDCTDRPCLFEYRKHKKNNKKSKEKKQLIHDEQSYQSEFKVRVIEKLNNLSGILKQYDPSFNCGNIKNGQMDDTQLNQSYFTYVFQIVSKIIEIHQIPKEQIKMFLNEQDEHGFYLIHYLTALGYNNIIKLLIQYGLNINQIGLDGLTPLQIAVLTNQENMVNFLIQQGAIESQFQGENKVDQLFEMESIYKNRNILDLLVRGVTLCDSLQNSSSVTDQRSWNQQEEQEDQNYFNLDEICNEIFLEHLEDQPEKINIDQVGINHEEKVRNFIFTPKPKPHKVKLQKNYSKLHKQNIEQEPSEIPSNQVYDDYQDHIKVIQKNVRGWLLRRQYLDMKYATQVLQNYIRNKIAKKHINPNCKQKIKDTLRNWLNLKQL